MGLSTLLDLSRRLNPDELRAFLAQQNQPTPITPPNVGAGLQNTIPPTGNAPVLNTKPMPDLTKDTPQIPIDSASARLQRLLYSPPLRSDYEPSTGRKVGAGIVGTIAGLTGGGLKHGMDTATNIRNAPYNEAYQDWLTKTKALEQQTAEEGAKGKLDVEGITAAARAANVDPNVRGQIVGAESAAKLPFELAVQDPRLKTQKDIAATKEAGEQSRLTQREAGETARTASQISSRHEDVATQQAGENARTKMIVDQRARQFEAEYGLQVDRNAIQRDLVGVRNAQATVGMAKAKETADQAAAKLLLQKPEYKDLVIQPKDSTGKPLGPPRIGTASEILNSGRSIFHPFTGARMTLDDYNKTLLKYKHDLMVVSQGYMDTAKNMGVLTEPGDVSSESQSQPPVRIKGTF